MERNDDSQTSTPLLNPFTIWQCSQTQFETGKVIGNGVSIVYEGTLQIAIKVIRNVKINSNELKRIVNELETQTQCFHPNIVRLIGYSVNPQRKEISILMERRKYNLHSLLQNDEDNDNNAAENYTN